MKRLLSLVATLLALALLGCAAEEGTDSPVVLLTENQDDSPLPEPATGSFSLTADWSATLSQEDELSSPDGESYRLIDPATEWFRVKAASGPDLTLFADLTPAENEATFSGVPVGDYTIGVTAWDEDGTFGTGLFLYPNFLSYGEATATVSPCSSPCETPTEVSITLAPTELVFTAPGGIIYDSPDPQDVAVKISLMNWPLSLQQATMAVYLTDGDFPGTITVFEAVCEMDQILTDETVRECSGTIPATTAPFPSTARLVVIIDSVSWTRDFGDGNGETLFPMSSGAGIPDIMVLSDTLGGL